MFIALFSWQEFYAEPSSPVYTLPRNKYTSSQTVSQGSYYVFACFFASCSASKGGGVFVSAETKLLVEETSFSSCKATSGSGGGLFISSVSSCLFSKVCSYQCKATSSGQFCYHSLSQSAEYTTKLKDCAISYTNNPDCDGSIYIQFGLIFVSSVNSSFNKCCYYSGIRIDPLPSGNLDCSVTFSCFSNNEGKSGKICVNFYSSSSQAEMRSCNVVGNKQDGSSYGTVTATYTYLYIYDSIVIDNVAPYSIATNHGTVNINNTIFDKIDSGCSIQSKAKSSFTNILLFIKTGECDAENPKSFTKANIKTYVMPVYQRISVFKLSFLVFACVCY